MNACQSIQENKSRVISNVLLTTMTRLACSHVVLVPQMLEMLYQRLIAGNICNQNNQVDTAMEDSDSIQGTAGLRSTDLDTADIIDIFVNLATIAHKTAGLLFPIELYLFLLRILQSQRAHKAIRTGAAKVILLSFRECNANYDQTPEIQACYLALISDLPNLYSTKDSRNDFGVQYAKVCNVILEQALSLAIDTSCTIVLK